MSFRTTIPGFLVLPAAIAAASLLGPSPAAARPTRACYYTTEPQTHSGCAIGHLDPKNASLCVTKEGSRVSEFSLLSDCSKYAETKHCWGMLETAGGKWICQGELGTLKPGRGGEECWVPNPDKRAKAKKVRAIEYYYDEQCTRSGQIVAKRDRGPEPSQIADQMRIKNVPSFACAAGQVFDHATGGCVAIQTGEMPKGEALTGDGAN